MCADGWDYGEPNGEPTVDGVAATGCLWSPVTCDTCGAAPCDGSC